MTITLGSRKSSLAVAARRNSGFMHTPRLDPALRPEERSRAGISTVSVVPGGTVLRTTTRGHPGCAARALPNASVADTRYERSTRPSTVGVGTDTRYASALTDPRVSA